MAYKDKETERASRRRYWQTPAGKAARRRHNQKQAVKTMKRRYAKTPAGKAAQRRYAQTPAGKAAIQRANQKPNSKAAKSRYAQQKFATDLYFKLKIYLRTRLYIALKSKAKRGSAVRDLGCSIEFLKQHLESQFQPGMTWENHSPTGWHIDHKRPLDSFDLTNPMQLKAACHYTNLQPLWAKENFSKSNKYYERPPCQFTPRLVSTGNHKLDMLNELLAEFPLERKRAGDVMSHHPPRRISTIPAL